MWFISNWEAIILRLIWNSKNRKSRINTTCGEIKTSAHKKHQFNIHEVITLSSAIMLSSKIFQLKIWKKRTAATFFSSFFAHCVPYKSHAKQSIKSKLHAISFFYYQFNAMCTFFVNYELFQSVWSFEESPQFEFGRIYG